MNRPNFVEGKIPIVMRSLASFDADEFEKIATLDDLIKTFTKIKKDNPGFKEYRVEVSKDYDSGYYLSELSVNGAREETDEEYRIRKEQYEENLKLWEKQEKDLEKERLKKEKEDYLRLKKKFENG